MQLLFSGRLALLDQQLHRCPHSGVPQLRRSPGLEPVRRRSKSSLRTAATRKPRKTKNKEPQPEEAPAAEEPEATTKAEETQDAPAEEEQSSEPDSPPDLSDDEAEELARLLVEQELGERQYADPDFLPTTRPSPVLSNREVPQPNSPQPWCLVCFPLVLA